MATRRKIARTISASGSRPGRKRFSSVTTVPARTARTTGDVRPAAIDNPVSSAVNGSQASLPVGSLLLATERNALRLASS